MYTLSDIKLVILEMLFPVYLFASTEEIQAKTTKSRNTQRPTVTTKYTSTQLRLNKTQEQNLKLSQYFFTSTMAYPTKLTDRTNKYSYKNCSHVYHSAQLLYTIQNTSENVPSYPPDKHIDQMLSTGQT